jgi:hypothetical protein
MLVDLLLPIRLRGSRRVFGDLVRRWSDGIRTRDGVSSRGRPHLCRICGRLDRLLTSISRMRLVLHLRRITASPRCCESAKYALSRLAQARSRGNLSGVVGNMNGYAGKHRSKRGARNIFQPLQPRSVEFDILPLGRNACRSWNLNIVGSLVAADEGGQCSNRPRLVFQLRVCGAPSTQFLESVAYKIIHQAGILELLVDL